MSNKQIVLVVAAHPDDEILGCGGTMARHHALGDTVAVVIMAEGITSRFRGDERTQQANALAELEATSRRAQSCVGVDESIFLHLPDNRMDELAMLDIVQPLEAVVSRIRPSIVYTHHWGDLNIDHELTCRAVMTACRPQPGASVREILHFEIASATGWDSPRASFSPAVFVDISEYLEMKAQSLEVYKDEMRQFPHARSVDSLKALARYRGAHVGLHAAEAFMLGRRVVR